MSKIRNHPNASQSPSVSLSVCVSLLFTWEPPRSRRGNFLRHVKKRDNGGGGRTRTETETKKLYMFTRGAVETLAVARRRPSIRHTFSQAIKQCGKKQRPRSSRQAGYALTSASPTARARANKFRHFYDTRIVFT